MHESLRGVGGDRDLDLGGEALPGDQVECLKAVEHGLQRGGLVNLTVSSGPATVSVPDVTGKRMSQARQQMEAAGLRVRAVSLPGFDGPVLTQSPGGGQTVKTGTTVSLFGL